MDEEGALPPSVALRAPLWAKQSQISRKEILIGQLESGAHTGTSN